MTIVIALLITVCGPFCLAGKHQCPRSSGSRETVEWGGFHALLESALARIQLRHVCGIVLLDYLRGRAGKNNEEVVALGD
jgi:hypothetical protein